MYTSTYNYSRLPEHLFFWEEYYIYVSIYYSVPNETLYKIGERDAVFTNDTRDKDSCDVFSSPKRL